MNTQHTPGPWTIRKNIYGSLDLFGDNGNQIIGSQFLLMNQEANARLIEAAPDLVAVIEALLSLNQTQGVTPEEYEAACDAANAAIAKAKGETL